MIQKSAAKGYFYVKEIFKSYLFHLADCVYGVLESREEITIVTLLHFIDRVQVGLILSTLVVIILTSSESSFFFSVSFVH